MVYRFGGGVSGAQALIFVAVVVVALAAMLDADIGCTVNSGLLRHAHMKQRP